MKQLSTSIGIGIAVTTILMMTKECDCIYARHGMTSYQKVFTKKVGEGYRLKLVNGVQN